MMISSIDHEEDERAMKVLPGSDEKDDDLNPYSILLNKEVQSKSDFVDDASAVPVLDRAMGSMCGMAVGDALGHPYEFEPAQDVPERRYFDLATMRFHEESNHFRLKRGQWTDDAAMGNCMADSLIMRRNFDGSDMRVRFWCWWNRGYNNAFRKDSSRSHSVGLGLNIRKSLDQLKRIPQGKPIPPVFKADGEDAGNGSLMRFAPIAVFFHNASMPEVHHYARASSYTTHPGIMAALACELLAHLIVRAINRPTGAVDPKAFLNKYTAEYYEMKGLKEKSGWGYDQMKWLLASSSPNAEESCWNWRSEHQSIKTTLRARGKTYNGYPVSSGYFGSFSMDGLALALWSVYNTTNFNEAVVKSVNLFGDADSHGSITGQLAGALYGYSTIHPQFVAWLNKWDDHDFAVKGVLLHQIGANRVPEADVV
jgi:ADP-ribosyl-[dinitrogen reductase] hydrolase